MGLNKLRLNSAGKEPFSIPKARAFATLDAAIAAQKEMIKNYDGQTLIVITAYQDSYLDAQLKPFLKPNSKTEYDLSKVRRIRTGFPDIKPQGNLATFDFVTVHQNEDLSVLYYETMDFGKAKNKDLIVKHKGKLYPPHRAGTIYIVTPIQFHRRSPRDPFGTK